MRFTEHRDFPVLRTVNLLTDGNTFSQNGGFEQPSVAALAQETIVMLGRHFDQYLQELKVIMRAQKNKKKYDNIPKFCALRKLATALDSRQR